jgi:hypothetical protein
MVEMGQADPEFKFRGHMGQYPDQGHGIRPPGNGHKYGIARLYHIMGHKGLCHLAAEAVRYGNRSGHE